MCGTQVSVVLARANICSTLEVVGHRRETEIPLEPEQVIFEPLFPDVEIPSSGSSGAAGYDVRAYLRGRIVQIAKGLTVKSVHVVEELIIPPGGRAAIPLGFRARLPQNIEGQIRLRSSVGFKKGLTIPNAPGTIDPDYPGEWLVIVSNSLSESVSVKHGERIAQVVFSRFNRINWAVGIVQRTSDRRGGLGSTGE